LLLSKLYAGKLGDSFIMIRSRVTLARIEAAAMEREIRSPPTSRRVLG